MSEISLAETISAISVNDEWGPALSTTTTLDGVPYAPYSKSDKLGRMADWTQEGKEGRDRGGRQYGRNYRDQQIYGAGTSSLFAVQAAEDEATFSVVDNTRTTAKGRGFGRGGVTVFRGRGQRGAAQRGARGAFQRVGQGRTGGQQQGQFFDQRGGRGGRGRRFGWRDYDKPQRNRDASVNIRPDWIMKEEIDFNRLAKLNLETPDGEDIDSYGFLYYYDRSYDKAPVKNTERKLLSLERAAYNVTTSADPVIQELAEKDEATIFATSDILSMLMCATRSVYSWDIVILKHGDKIFLDKRPDSSIDLVTVNENAADAPLEADTSSTPSQQQTGVKPDSINTPSNLAMEATMINHNFAFQTVIENPNSKVEFPHPNPFYSASEETDPLASKAYKYRRFDLSLERDEEPLNLIVRTELDAAIKNNISGEDQFLTLKALNEFDHKAQGSGGALDWRTKLTSQRGAVVATEMKNNSCKLARWTTQAILAKADQMKLGFVSRANPKSAANHVILGVVGYKPREFASQMNLGFSNGWGIVRTIVDLVRSMSDAADEEEEGKEEATPAKDRKYVLIKDPNKPVIRLYEVPLHTFEDEDDGMTGTVAETDAAGEEAEE
ncbi:eukaryotic translation initiation factor 3 subunit D [Fonsecaea monophora]|uniref:Eukaryotic translation initiation factor 3 subunit D n=2 Tax=Fonsecaea TaxID=40354 RepID=A0A0D2GQE1_9EURO|nr:eukaryotic translation initiation factor 3 subunit D [Fonsecaea pedrosoi CBS 271.37]XP_022517488.1 eukaryotic translation initiation factor 3 subunit D [Fonsecaea monophora]KAH0842205.1 Eukaryotic translation initiation factor 3 subunit D [Fonsecaea pedrosoi]KIW83208.1 eukaryotic translation initiation factor 3 subunit D [Fonsecaea pedrosoi CBS 271.37]OAG45536.1 eukaryotic translation initiation factor 3 subunit D [Fonsecaea monophora]